MAIRFSHSECQALVASVVRVQQLQQGKEERPPPSPLEVLLSTRNEMLLSYVTLLQVTRNDA
eukprot:1289856-Rhodomonas_salina.1